jgi:predicted ATPase
MFLSEVIIRSSEFPTRSVYPFNLPVLQKTGRIAFTSPLTFFVGENGSGKSTLLTAITRKCGIHIWKGKDGRRVEQNPYEEAFHHFINVRWNDGPVPGSFFASQMFQNFSRILDEWAAADPGLLDYFGGRSLMTQSHGQSILSFFRSRFKVKGIYFLDEPETALSPRSQIDLLNLLAELARSGNAQFLVASHSPILLACPGARIYTFDSAPIETIAYEETAYYRIYRDFLLNRDRFIGSRA